MMLLYSMSFVAGICFGVWQVKKIEKNYQEEIKEIAVLTGDKDEK